MAFATKVRPVLISSPGAGAPLLGQVPTSNIANENSPATVSSTSGLGSAANYGSATNKEFRSYVLLNQPYLQPLLQFEYSTVDISDANGKASFYIYGQQNDVALALPWDTTTLCWNNKPALPTDADTICSPFTLLGAGIPGDGPATMITFDLRQKSGFVALGVLLRVIPNVGQQYSIQFSKLSVLSQQANTVYNVTNRASVGTTRTLTLDRAHNLTNRAKVLISGVTETVIGSYNPTDAFGNPIWVSVTAIPSTTQISYAAPGGGAITESVAATGSVAVQATGF